jgi:hypothetical protein
MSKRVLVCGDRNWTNLEAIRRELSRHRPSVVIHGTARGADTLAGIAALELGISVERYPANWTKYGRAAGPIRNRQMLEIGRPDLVLAFHENIADSRGTADMIRIAEKKGVPVELHTK